MQAHLQNFCMSLRSKGQVRWILGAFIPCCNYHNKTCKSTHVLIHVLNLQLQLVVWEFSVSYCFIACTRAHIIIDSRKKKVIRFGQHYKPSQRMESHISLSLRIKPIQKWRSPLWHHKCIKLVVAPRRWEPCRSDAYYDERTHLKLTGFLFIKKMFGNVMMVIDAFGSMDLFNRHTIYCLIFFQGIL